MPWQIMPLITSLLAKARAKNSVAGGSLVTSSVQRRVGGQLGIVDGLEAFTAIEGRAKLVPEKGQAGLAPQTGQKVQVGAFLCKTELVVPDLGVVEVALDQHADLFAL
jgi:hypothetical protein